jgi:hypothetical protein
MDTKYKYLFMDFPPMGKFTEEDRIRNSYRPITGNCRLSNGMYRTSEEQEKYLEESLALELP